MFLDEISERIKTPDPLKRNLALPVFFPLLEQTKWYGMSEEEEISYLKEMLQTVNSLTYQAITKMHEGSKYPKVKKYIVNVFTESLRTGTCADGLRRSQSSDEYQLKSISLNSILNGDGNSDTSEAFQIFVSLLECIPKIYPESSLKERTDLANALCTFMTSCLPKRRFPEVKRTQLELYKHAVICAINIIELSNVGLIQKPDVEAFVHRIIVHSFEIVMTLFDIATGEYKQRAKYVQYIGELVSILAVGVCGLGDNERLPAQQFWYYMVIFAGDIQRELALWSRDMIKFAVAIDPLVNCAGVLSYQNPFELFTNLIKMMPETAFRPVEEIAAIINRIIPAIATKALMTLTCDEAYFLLSIITLERARAAGGHIDGFFLYLDLDYSETFGMCLNALFPVIFADYKQGLGDLEETERIASVQRLASIAFKGLAGKKPHIFLLIEQIVKPLVMEEPQVMFSADVIAAFIDGFSDTFDDRHTAYVAMGRTLLQTATVVSKNLLFARLNEYFIKMIKENPLKMGSIYGIVALLPDDVHEEFMSLFATMMYVSGGSDLAAGQKKPENRKMEAFLNSIRLIQEEAVDKVLDPEIDPDMLNIIWSNVLLQPKLEEKFMILMIHQFITSVSTGQGIFSLLGFDAKTVQYQEEVMIFLNEQLIRGKMSDQIGNIFCMISRSKMTEDPGALSCLLTLGKFVITVLRRKDTTPNTSKSCVHIFIDVVLRIVAMRSSPHIFRYIKKNTSERLLILIKFMKEVTDYFNARNTAGCKDKKGNLRGAIDSHQKRIFEANFLDVDLHRKMLDLVSWVLSHEYCMYHTYAGNKLINNEVVDTNWLRPRMYFIDDVVPLLWKWHPPAIPAIANALMIEDQVFSMLKPYFSEYPYHLAFSTNMVAAIAKIKIDDLSLCGLVDPGQAIGLLTPDILNHPSAATYWIRCLNEMQLDELLQYIPQLVQCLTDDSCKKLRRYMRNKSLESDIFAHYLLWNLCYEKCVKRSNEDILPLILVKLEGKICHEMTPEKRMFYEHEFGLVNAMAEISRRLLPMKPEDRKTALISELEKFRNNITNDLYVPSNPSCVIQNISPSDSRPLKSHSRVPILVAFDVYDLQSQRRDIVRCNCIFKIEDDVRMDAMMIQFIDKFQRIFDDAGLKTYMNPYRVFATGQERGVIQCIHKSKSRHEMGTERPVDLLHYFIHEFGQIGTDGFKKAQQNFIESLAPYSLLCYIFQVKDRHNANIMFDNEGHIMHIDFGFIFDIAPGNIKFEAAPFKLTGEMVQLLGGSRDAPSFKRFELLFHQCFLAVRTRYREIEPIAYLMKQAGFGCFKADSFKRLAARFALDKYDYELAGITESLITDSLGAITTAAYDRFQFTQNAIFYI